MIQRLSYLIVFILLSICASSQENVQIDSNYILVQKELKDFKNLRTKDSLRIDILTKEIKALLSKNIEEESKKSIVDSTEIKRKLAEIDRIKAITQGAPVVLNNDTLFKVYARVGQYSAFDRANSAHKNILSLYESPFFIPDSLKVENNFNTEIITYNGKIIIGINEFDALWESTTPNELAETFKTIISNKIQEQRAKNSLKFKLIRAGEFLLILLIVALIIRIVNKLTKKLKEKLFKENSLIGDGLKVKNNQVFKRQQLITFISKVIDLLKNVLFLIIIFSALPLALKVFPSTSAWAIEVQKIILEPIKSLLDSLVSYLPELVKIIFILILGRYTLKLLRYFAFEIGKGAITIKGFYKEWAKPTYLIVRFLFIVFLLIIIFPYLPGSGTTAFQGVSVFLGILISIGSSSAISNAVAGIVITYMRPFQLKDWIKSGSITGVVIEKNALVTRLKTINNEDITIPNSTILTGATVNFSSIGKQNGLSISTQISVRYVYDEDLITDLLIVSAKKTIGVTDKIKPYVFQISLNDNNATYEINAITFEPERMYHIKSDLIRNIHTTFKENNISLKSVQFIDIIENKNPF